MGFPPQGTVVMTPITSEEIWEYTTRVLTNLSTSRARSGEFEVGFPITPSSQTVLIGTYPITLNAVTLTPSIPTGASLVGAKLIAMITILENSGGAPGAQEIDLNVQVRKTAVPAAAWQNVFTETDVIGLTNNQSTTVGWGGAMDVAVDLLGDPLVNAMDVQYEFTFTVDGGIDQIRFTQGFVLIVKYRMA